MGIAVLVLSAGNQLSNSLTEVTEGSGGLGLDLALRGVGEDATKSGRQIAGRDVVSGEPGRGVRQRRPSAKVKEHRDRRERAIGVSLNEES